MFSTVVSMFYYQSGVAHISYDFTQILTAFTLASALIDSYTSRNSKFFDAKMSALVKAGLDLKKPQGNGSSLYHLAIAKNDLELLKKIDALGIIDINAKDNEHQSLLACHLGNRHLAMQIINEKTIRIEYDHVIFDMLIGLNAKVIVIEDIFEPELGAYGSHNH